MKERKGVWGAQVTPRDLQRAMIGYGHAAKEAVREGGARRGLTCSGVSSIGAQTKP